MCKKKEISYAMFIFKSYVFICSHFAIMLLLKFIVYDYKKYEFSSSKKAAWNWMYYGDEAIGQNKHLGEVRSSSKIKTRRHGRKNLPVVILRLWQHIMNLYCFIYLFIIIIV